MLKRYWLRTFLLALTVTQIAIPLGSLAQQVHPVGKRKMIVEIRPVYPLLARKANLAGTVRLRVTVSPAGYPVSTEQLGGGPVLVKARYRSSFAGQVGSEACGDQGNRPNQISTGAKIKAVTPTDAAR